MFSRYIRRSYLGAENTGIENEALENAGKDMASVELLNERTETTRHYLTELKTMPPWWRYT